jgi:hypothetical protein
MPSMKDPAERRVVWDQVVALARQVDAPTVIDLAASSHRLARLVLRFNAQLVGENVAPGRH